MDAFLIEGPTKLHGSVEIGGAKNAALPAIAATLLTEEPVTLANLPRVADIRTMQKLLTVFGVKIEEIANVPGASSAGPQTPWPGSLTFRADGITSTEAPYDVVRTMRASILVLGPLLARFGEAWVSLPGGCAIGVRPVDLHLKAFEAMGARIAVEKGYIHAYVSRVGAKHGRLIGTTVKFPTSTVTGTENVLLAATLAEGTTRIENAAREPEITDLAELLTSMGAVIRGAGTTTIEVDGADSLHGNGETPHRVMPDRIEAGTYLAAGALTGGDVTVTNARADHLGAFLSALRAAGVTVEEGDGSIRVQGGDLSATDIVTAPHPGYPTDLQAQLMALLTQAKGTSRVIENIFENRFLHATELSRLGANIGIDGNTAIVMGKTVLQGAPVTASDLRASAALVLAGLVAEGETLVRRIYHLDRGYAAMETRLNSLGARIERVSG